MLSLDPETESAKVDNYPYSLLVEVMDAHRDPVNACGYPGCNYQNHHGRELIDHIREEHPVFKGLDNPHFLSLNGDEVAEKPEAAKVLATNPENLFRPQVQVLWDSDWTRIDPPRRFDLSETADVTVARMLLESELPLT